MYVICSLSVTFSFQPATGRNPLHLENSQSAQKRQWTFKESMPAQRAHALLAFFFAGHPLQGLVEAQLGPFFNDSLWLEHGFSASH